MLTSDQLSRRGDFPHDPAFRGYRFVYRPHQANPCPGCGRSQWIVGRLLAECAYCATALPMAASGMTGAGSIRRSRTAPDAAPLAA